MSDIRGGAARAAYRIHRSLLAAGVESRMRVNRKFSDDWTVEGPRSKGARMWADIRPRFGSLLKKCHRSGEQLFYSTNLLPSRWAARLNQEDWDIVHLHWVGAEMLSVADIGRIMKPIVWTLHDMQAFCGAEHYTMGERWKEGYRRDNRLAGESGIDLNRSMGERKRKHWRRPMHIVTPSHWLASCARESALMAGWPVHTIAHPLDLRTFAPVEAAIAREFLGLPTDKKLVVFGALGGGQNYVKGFDLLLEALRHLSAQRDDLELLVFGQGDPREPLELGLPVHYSGRLYDDLSLRMVYNAADVMVVPSRMEAFGQTASEAHACGTPVVTFAATGLCDIVTHKETGYLAKPYDPTDLARGIGLVLDLNGSPEQVLSQSARAKAEREYDPMRVAGEYVKIYRQAMRATPE